MTESIYIVSVYRYLRHRRKSVRYPCVKLRESELAYFATLEEAEKFVHQRGMQESPFPDTSACLGTYAFVITELPLAMALPSLPDHYLSLRVYLPDGTLWGKNDYCNLMPRDLSAEQYNLWGERNIFYGRNPEEVRFRPGDIVEVLGCRGNRYWGQEEANLAIVVDTPRTKDEIAQMKQDYHASHEGFDLCPHAISVSFNEHLDTYKVLSLSCDTLDWAPTVATFPPRLHVSTRIEEKLHQRYDSWKNLKT